MKFNNPQAEAILDMAKDVAIEVMKVVDKDTGAATRAMIAAIEATHREELEKQGKRIDSLNEQLEKLKKRGIKWPETKRCRQ